MPSTRTRHVATKSQAFDSIGTWLQSVYLTRGCLGVPVAHAASLIKLGVQVTQALNVGRFSEGQRRCLRFHRESVLLRSKYLEGVDFAWRRLTW